MFDHSLLKVFVRNGLKIGDFPLQVESMPVGFVVGLQLLNVLEDDLARRAEKWGIRIHFVEFSTCYS